MYKKSLINLSIFFIYCAHGFTSVFAQNSGVAFEFVKIDNAYQVWGKLKASKMVYYDSIDGRGVPINLTLNFKVTLLSIRFTASSDSSALFRYKLEGYADKWSDLGKKNEVSYFKLPAGNYDFKVQYYSNGNFVEEKDLKISISETFDYYISLYILPVSLSLIIFGIFYSFKTARLRKNQKILEQTVKDRTAEIVLQKDEIILQKHILEEKHREISDSINYAKRIQTALLTSEEYWDFISPDNFVIWRPKDVVSGDFYWAYQLNLGDKQINAGNEITIWCAADCTGHGVPGAFMSMLGMSFLNEIVVENVTLKPADILSKLRKKITSALEQGNVGNIEQKDGMDMALCVWYKSTNILEYAGANNPVWIIRPILNSKAHEIIELKANRMPVGYHTEIKEFTQQSFQLQKGDSIYVFTDGIVDQFGGPDGKKFKSKKLKETLLGLQHLNMKDQALMINKEFDNWKGMNEQIDDLCVVGIRVS